MIQANFSYKNHEFQRNWQQFNKRSMFFAHITNRFHTYYFFFKKSLSLTHVIEKNYQKKIKKVFKPPKNNKCVLYTRYCFIENCIKFLYLVDR